MFKYVHDWMSVEFDFGNVFVSSSSPENGEGKSVTASRRHGLHSLYFLYHIMGYSTLEAG